MASAGCDSGIKCFQLFFTRAGRHVISVASRSISERARDLVAAGSDQNERPEKGGIVIIDIIAVACPPYRHLVQVTGLLSIKPELTEYIIHRGEASDPHG
jgi:hypothetical protein